MSCPANLKHILRWLKFKYLCSNSIICVLSQSCVNQCHFFVGIPCKSCRCNSFSLSRSRSIYLSLAHTQFLSHSLFRLLSLSLPLFLSLSLSRSLSLLLSRSHYLSLPPSLSLTHTLIADQPALPARHRRKDRRIPHHPQTRCVNRLSQVKF